LLHKNAMLLLLYSMLLTLPVTKVLLLYIIWDFVNVWNFTAGGSQVKPELSSPVVGAESAGDVVIQTIHAQDARIQDRPPWPTALGRINNSYPQKGIFHCITC
jgi:hypothetical protein